jgi:uncharacterized protein DUF4783
MKRSTIVLILIASVLGIIAIIGFVKSNDHSIESNLSTAMQTQGIPFKDLLAKGDAAGLGQYFASEVTIALPGKEDDFSKKEAISVLSRFFIANPPQSFVVKHNGLSPKGEAQFHIGQLKTEKGSFRTTLMVQKELIQEIRFEKE